MDKSLEEHTHGLTRWYNSVVCVCVCVCMCYVCISGLLKRYMVENEICVIHTMAKYLLLTQRQDLTESAHNMQTKTCITEMVRSHYNNIQWFCGESPAKCPPTVG